MIKESDQPLVRPWQPTPEQEKAIRATDATTEWLYHLPAEILRRYQGQWIAAKDCRIVASGQTMEELHANLGDIDLGTVVIMRLERPGLVIYR